MSRREGSMKNFIWGIIGTVITSLIAIVIPRLFIVNYGSEINGFLSSIRQIYIYLALLEAGVGSASLQALYRPLAVKDRESINKILSATHYYYKRTGIIYFLGIIAMGLIYPLFLDTSIPYCTCFFVIVLQGMGNVINYLFVGKYVTLLNADNKAYINNNCVTIISVFTDIFRILLLLNGKSIIIIQSTYLFFNIIKMVFIIVYTYKKYPWLNLNVKPDLNAISQKNAVLVHQISSLIFSNTDVLILTFVCGLKIVSIYSIYASMYSIINNIISIVSASIQSALGQIFNSDKERFILIQDTYEAYFISLVFSLFTIMFILILPFLKLYTAGSDINYLDSSLVLLFTLYQLLNYGRTTSGQILTFAGEFSSTKWRAILESIINLTVSFIFVFKFGIYGVLLGTIAALFYRANDMIIFANHRVLKRSAKSTYRRWIRNFIIFIILSFIFSQVNLYVNSYKGLFLEAIFVSVIVISIYFGLTFYLEKDARNYLLNFIKQTIKHKKVKS